MFIPSLENFDTVGLKIVYFKVTFILNYNSTTFRSVSDTRLKLNNMAMANVSGVSMFMFKWSKYVFV